MWSKNHISFEFHFRFRLKQNCNPIIEFLYTFEYLIFRASLSRVLHNSIPKHKRKGNFSQRISAILQDFHFFDKSLQIPSFSFVLFYALFQTGCIMVW